MSLRALARLRSEAGSPPVPTSSPTPAAPSIPGGALVAEPAEDAQPDWCREPPVVEPVQVEPRRPRVERTPGVCGRCGAPTTQLHAVECPRSDLWREVPVRVRPLDEMPPKFADMSPAERVALGMRVEPTTQESLRG